MSQFLRTSPIKEAQLLEWFQKLVVTGTKARRRDDILEAIWNEGEHRMPCSPLEWTFYPERCIIAALIHKGMARHQLIQEMLCSPGRIYLVSDALMPGAESLNLCVAGFSQSEIFDWLTRMRPARMVIGEYQGTSLITAPLISFTQD